MNNDGTDDVDNDQTCENEDEGCDDNIEGLEEWFEIVAQIIGVIVDDLWVAIESGQTIAEIANENGVNTQTVIGAVTSIEYAAIDGLVAEGEIDAAEGEEWKAEFAAEVTELIDEVLYDDEDATVSGDAGDSIVPNTIATRRPLDVNKVPPLHSLTEISTANDPGDGNSSTTHTVFLPVVIR